MNTEQGNINILDIDQTTKQELEAGTTQSLKQESEIETVSITEPPDSKIENVVGPKQASEIETVSVAQKRILSRNSTTPQARIRNRNSPSAPVKT